MKAVINEKETPVKYPWIGEAPDDDGKTMITLFVNPNEGYFIGGESTAWPYMHYLKHWVEKNFTPFTGTITLSND
jgi:hypothetical protein